MVKLVKPSPPCAQAGEAWAVLDEDRGVDLAGHAAERCRCCASASPRSGRSRVRLASPARSPASTSATRTTGSTGIICSRPDQRVVRAAPRPRPAADLGAGLDADRRQDPRGVLADRASLLMTPACRGPRVSLKMRCSSRRSSAALSAMRRRGAPSPASSASATGADDEDLLLVGADDVVVEARRRATMSRAGLLEVGRLVDDRPAGCPARRRSRACRCASPP